MPFNGVVEPPKLEPASHGVLSGAAEVIRHTADDHWGNQITYETDNCNTKVDLWMPCNSGTSSASVVNQTGVRWFDAYPYAIVAKDICSTVGVPVDERETRIKKKLELVTQKAVEFELWTGAAARAAAFSTRHLAMAGSTDVTTTPGTAVKPKLGLALLERALAKCGLGTQGTIHATTDAVTMLSGETITDAPVGDLLRTYLGTPIIAGAGYDGTGPGNAAVTGTKVWMYATGPVVVHLGAIENFSEEDAVVVKVATNDVILQVERLATAYWDGCCHYSVLIDLSL